MYPSSFEDAAQRALLHPVLFARERGDLARGTCVTHSYVRDCRGEVQRDLRVQSVLGVFISVRLSAQRPELSTVILCRAYRYPPLKPSLHGSSEHSRGLCALHIL